MKLLRCMFVLLMKEIRVEMRAKEIFYSSILFASVMVLLFSFSFLGGDPPSSEVKAGLLWVALSFSGVLSIQQCFARERDGDMLYALLLTPAPRLSIYISKFLAMFLLMSITLLWIVPLMIFFLQLRIAFWGQFAMICMLGIAGFVALACTFASPLGKHRKGSFLLPLLIYPLLIPIFIAGIRAMSSVLCDPSFSLLQCSSFQLQQGSGSEALRWIRFLGVFDLVFLLLGAWLFEPLCISE